MKNKIRIIIVVIPILYGFYFCFIKKEPAINFTEQEFIITGYVDDYPEKRISSNRYRFKIEKINDFYVTDGSRIIIVTDGYSKYNYGDELKIVGTIEKPQDFITDSGKTFDYDNYLRLFKIYGISRDPDVEFISNQKGVFIKKILFKIRKSFSEKINESLGYENASLVRGILLGEKSDLSNDFKTNMSRSSTSHIIALSGYNMTIVSETVIKLFSGFNVILKSILGSLGIFLFLIMAGGGSSAIRASIMSVVLLYTRARGYGYDNLYALYLAVAILVLISPLSLRYDAGFHLSVLATFGLITYSGNISAFLIKKRFNKFFAETLSSTISATIMTVPYIAYNIGIFSILGIFANIIIVPLIPFLMFLGFLTGMLPNAINGIFVFLTQTISDFMILTINKIGETQWSAYYVENFSLVLVILIYIFLFYKGFKLLRKDS